MFLCGSNFVGGALACAVTPTNLGNIHYIELKNGIYDDLYLSRTADLKPADTIPAEWDFDTILWATFDGNTNAGNVDWTLETTSHIILKSRRAGEFRWKTIAVREVNSIEDFMINHPDYFAASGETIEYAVVPVLHGSEGTYASTKVTPKFSKLFLIEGNTVWGTDMTDGYCNTTRNLPSSTVDLLNSKYPIFVRNTIANYDTGTCTGTFIPFIENDVCELAYGMQYDYQRITYQKAFMDFICDGIPKILKLPDGRMWLVQITPNPTDNARQSYYDREISFSWVEIGDADSEEDLYYLGLSDISPEWWNS